MQTRSAKTILICEDDDNLRQLIRVVIGDGYDVMEAGDGYEALALAQAHPPDLVILDLMMPRLSGLEVLQTLREQLPDNRMSVLVMSAWPQSDDAAFQAGADAFLQKPFEPDHLVAVVNEILGEPAA